MNPRHALGAAVRRARRRRLGDAVTVGPGSQVDAMRVELRARPATVHVGASSSVSGVLVVERAGAGIVVGDRTSIGHGTILDAATGITVGDDVLISFDVLVFDHDSHSLDAEHRSGDVVAWMSGRKDWTHVPSAAVRFGDRCWVGARAIVLKGVTVGEGAVVGAGAVVTRDVEPFTVVAGNPARVIRQLRPTA